MRNILQERAGYIEMDKQPETKREPGVCIPWQEKLKELPRIPDNEELVKKVWEDVDGLGYMYIWQCLLSF